MLRSRGYARDNAPMPNPRHRSGSSSGANRAVPRRKPDVAGPPVAPLTEAELDELQALLDTVPAPLEPLDVSMLDGYLCGVLVQPQAIEAKRWLAHITDVDGRALPPGFDAARLHVLALRRHAELNAAIAQRRWFDPWVFELEDDSGAGMREAGAPVDLGDRTRAAGVSSLQGGEDHEDHDDQDDEDGGDTGLPPAIDAVYPWVAGFATALELFPALMGGGANTLTEPLALLYRHLAPDDLEDADELLAEIETLEPPVDLEEAVEGLVRATLLLADVGRPQAASGRRHSGTSRRR